MTVRDLYARLGKQVPPKSRHLHRQTDDRIPSWVFVKTEAAV
ncbi:hypothetical protein [Prescottella agglutinans]|uniref:Ribosomal protein L39E n=1 Tax=Prescottella agglutinans TaxID=1644129 RepID=A0ABT6M6E0_9NOCA|nr:hypothetical protein [Prescottella agglutinans]MDH6279485.1 ribosomal protein L39E [Prescottella agglutinans]